MVRNALQKKAGPRRRPARRQDRTSAGRSSGVAATAVSSDRRALAARFQALSDPTRLAILERLRQGERCVCDLTDLLDAAQSRLSFHLRVLLDAGLVHQRRAGRWMYYSLEPDAFAGLAQALDGIMGDEAGEDAAGACCGRGREEHE